MNNGRRYKSQRSNRVRLKADAFVLLQAIEQNGAKPYLDEIAEMKVRLRPPTGAAAPIVLTGYTKARKTRGPVPEVPITDWKAEAVLRAPVDGMDERFGIDLHSIRYRKD